MILAVDAGNTQIVLGCIEGGEISNVMRLETNRKKTEYEYAATIGQILSISNITKSDFAGAVISSVVPQLTETLRIAVRLITGYDALIVGSGIKTGLNISIDDPSETGADIVASAVATISMGYKPPIIIIDMGTATTLSVIDKNLRMIGGAILPGPNVSMEALTGRASLLPHIPIEPPKKCISSNTIDAMKSGAVFGAAASIDGMIDRMEEELGDKAFVIATGGLARKVIPYCRHTIEFDNKLLLRGLWAIWEKNKK
jgi:type III pantothenate kinase